jgi:hypothetical protein
VAGGRDNTASGQWSQVSGGYFNTAGGNESYVGGGYSNSASGLTSSIAGGFDNTASSTYATLSGARPQYDSGWVSIAAGENKTLTHNLGGNVNDYIVDVSFRGPGDFEIHHLGYGDAFPDFHGTYWGGLTSDKIGVERGVNENGIVDQVRVRIWVNN